MLQDQALVLTTESTSASETHIFDVNLHCLHEIFSLECLTMLDLCSIGETHDRFKEIVDDVFAKRFRNFEMILRKGRETIVDLKDTTRIFNNFVPFISQLSISGPVDHIIKVGNENSKKLEQLLALVTLDSLKLSCLRITEAETIELKPLFDKLQKLSLNSCTIYASKTLFSNCDSLVELKLVEVSFDDAHLVLKNTFSNLDRFEYEDTNYSLFHHSKQSNDFFSRHHNLKSLRLEHFFGMLHLLPGIADNCKQLAQLDIYIESDDDEEIVFTSILTFDHLNKLKIDCGDKNITKFIKRLNNLKSLEILCLAYVECDSQFVPALSKLTTLQELELICCKGLTNLNPLADLEQLTELKIESFENLDFDLLPSLLHIINRLINLKTLFLSMPSFKMDQQMYLQVVYAVQEIPRRFQDALQISCPIGNGVSANSFGDGYCRKLVRIIKVDECLRNILRHGRMRFHSSARRARPIATHFKLCMNDV